MCGTACIVSVPHSTPLPGAGVWCSALARGCRGRACPQGHQHPEALVAICVAVGVDNAKSHSVLSVAVVVCVDCMCLCGHSAYLDTDVYSWHTHKKERERERPAEREHSGAMAPTHRRRWHGGLNTSNSRAGRTEGRPQGAGTHTKNRERPAEVG